MEAFLRRDKMDLGLTLPPIRSWCRLFPMRGRVTLEVNRGMTHLEYPMRCPDRIRAKSGGGLVALSPLDTTPPGMLPSIHVRCHSSMLISDHSCHEASLDPSMCCRTRFLSASGRNNPRDRHCSPSSTSSANGLRGPRSHLARGTRKPIFRWFRTLWGSRPSALRRRMRFSVRWRTLSRPGMIADSSAIRWSRIGTRSSRE